MKKYDSSSIQVLEGLDAVRKRPGMYIGSTSSKGLHHLIWEIIDNSVDESLAGFCDEINVSLKNNIVRIEDNGRGIPIDIHPKTKKSSLETVFTILHAGGKFDSESYKISGGLHGVGASVVNALSKKLSVTVYKNNNEYSIEFQNGGKITKNLEEKKGINKTGTVVEFEPDKEIFKDCLFDTEKIENRLKEISFLNKGLTINFKYNKNEKKIIKKFNFKNGVQDFVEDLTKNQNKILTGPISINGEKNNIFVEASFQYTKVYKEKTLSFCNNIRTQEGGFHEDGLKKALIREFNNYNSKYIKNNNKYIWDDIKEGLTIILSIKHPNPEYEGQTKTKLGNKDAKDAVNSIIGLNIEKYLIENKKEAIKIFDKLKKSLNARIAAQKARDATRRKNLLDTQFNLPGKLSDCSSKNAEDCELFVVEGDSAGGSAKAGRDRNIQAILPLKGKVLNVEKAAVNRVFENNEIISIITALGTDIKEKFDIKKLRYDKIIIMTDADVDGSHIRILLLTLFYRYMKELIINGHIYIAQPPLYKITINNKSQYCYTDIELQKIKLKTTKSDKVEIQRYKGLGEMNAEQLWETTMNPRRRSLLKVSITEALETDLICSNLMGNDVEPRKDFISKNAKYVKNIDV